MGLRPRFAFADIWFVKLADKNLILGSIHLQMSFQDKLSRIEQLQTVISSHGKIPVDVLNKINYKFRLDWNYYSNSMEGNSLTQAETRSVMVGNITVEGKPFQDIMEMKNHDEIINSIIRMGKGELNISEKRIKELHSTIMYEEDPEKSKKIGQWKTEANYLHNYKGERFDFAAPGDVPERMHALVNWVNAEKEKIDRKDKKALHPILLAFRFHLDYVSIHPFYDGNGRTSRILCNIILISYGYPPLYVKTKERDSYYRYLADIQAYGGDPDLLYDFMAGLLIRSQEIVIDAIEGRDINSPEDLDKRLHLLDRRLEALDTERDKRLNLEREAFWDVYRDIISNLLLKSIEVTQKFNRFYNGYAHYISIRYSSVSLHPFEFRDEAPKDILDRLTKRLEQANPKFGEQGIDVHFVSDFTSFKTSGLDSVKYGWDMKINHTECKVLMDEIANPEPNAKKIVILERLSDQPLADNEIEQITKKLGDTILTHIEEKVKRLGQT